MEGRRKRTEKWRWGRGSRPARVLAGVLSVVLTALAALPYFPVLPVRAENGETVVLTTAYGDFGGEHKLYCIDKGEYAFWGIADDGDVYECHRPSALSLSLTRKEKEYVFWGLLTLQASLGIREAVEVVERIRLKASQTGGTPITKLVSEEDLKALIYSEKVRSKYPWLEEIAAHTEEYLSMGGLLSGAKTDSKKQLPSGMQVPTVLADSTSAVHAYPVNGPEFILSFDAGGADAAFIRNVPIFFSGDQGNRFQPEPTEGWSYQKTDTAIIFSHSNPNPPETLIRFATEGTEFAKAGGYASEEEVFDECLQVWECIKCSGNHQGGTPPRSETWHHQRLVWMEFPMQNVDYYASLGSRGVMQVGEGSLSFEVFRHEEDFTSHYNLQLYKFDEETGKPLSGARFALYERFEDAKELNTERDGAKELYTGGEPYAGGCTDAEPIWNGFRQAASVVTDEKGYAGQTAEHGYHYDKTFCDGHPAPVFVPVPEEEEDEETGEIVNEEAIREAQAKNQKLALDWLCCERDCETQAQGEWEGVHFHWLMEEVDSEEIRALAEHGGSPGETPEAGRTEGADGEEAFDASGCLADRDMTREKFLSLRYSYVWQEFHAKDGYLLHGLHRDDVPIEVITTDASEHGANSFFAGEYDLPENEKVSVSARKTALVRAAGSDFLFVDEDVWESEETEEGKKTVLLSEAALIGEGSGKATASEAFAEKPPIKQATAAELSGEEGNKKKATVSEALAVWPSDREATPSELSFVWEPFRAFSLYPREADDEEALTAALFQPAYAAALTSGSVGKRAESGVTDRFSHCNGADGEGDAWRIYDHRTEGEFHLSKRDLDLAAGEKDGDEAYGDTQGDAVLSGAVYGLFAASDLVHPDGKTGIVYRAGDLTATAAADQNGDASFLVYTQAPGYTYDYQKGTVVLRKNGWSEQAPENLYVRKQELQDYSEGNTFVRSYTNYEERNGNCWIGRPLLLGEYYVKELSRSEGYELSIGNRKQELTNYGQKEDIGSMETDTEKKTGEVCMVKQLYAEEQTGEDGEGAGPNELFFRVASKNTGKDGYQLFVSGLPEGVSFYRKDTGMTSIKTEKGTGIWEKRLLYQEDGSPDYIRAEHAYQYPKYQEDGSLLTRRVPVSRQAEFIRQVRLCPIQRETIEEVLTQTDGFLSQEELQRYLSEPFEETETFFLKERVERVLKRSKKSVAQSGETIDGCALPVQELLLKKNKEDGSQLSMTEAIVQVLAFYEKHPYFSCGGIESVKEETEAFRVTLVASVSGHPEYFMAAGETEETDSLIFHRLVWTPEDEKLPRRYVYVSYSNRPEQGAFGCYESYRSGTIGSSRIGSALLVPDAEIQADGTPAAKMREETVYYQAGELVRDEAGALMQKFRYEELKESVTEEAESVCWQPQPCYCREDGSYVLSVSTDYTDFFGASHQDQEEVLEMEWKAVLKEKEQKLSEEEAEQLGEGFFAGHRMNSASYYVKVKQARVKLKQGEQEELFGENSFLIPAELSYPGQEKAWQDAGTRERPALVYERILRQRIKITKKISDTALSGFRFKLYLRSNLERLYRNEKGEVVWLLQNGTETEPEALRHTFLDDKVFADVYKLYTRVPHETGSQTTGMIENNTAKEAVKANERLYSFDADGMLSDRQNSGYTRLLETKGYAEQVESGLPAGGAVYDYEKFFDAIRVANHDKWDLGEKESTSYKPFPLITAPSAEAKENQKVSDAVRQFAIRWYLKEEVKKKTSQDASGIRQAKEKSLASQEEIYEKAMLEAIRKAQNYLKPFFSYDLDEIYAIRWDVDSEGGSDRDQTTLAADKKGKEGYEALSKYLPYGIYVAVEQQPEEWISGDLKHRHYQIDTPKELSVPAGSSSHYSYHAAASPEELAAAYRIRMNEEWGSANQADERSFVICGNNQDGELEVYPYGLAADRRSGVIRTNGKEYPYEGFSFYQGKETPKKEYYEKENPACAGAYHKNKAVGSYYHYGSVSERAGELLGSASITGGLTGYENMYFPALVPWTVLAEGEETGAASEIVFQNTCYRAGLRLEKLDAETGEQILHDRALFSIYLAEREEGKEGRVRCYENDTLITGSREFLQAMGAERITPAARRVLFWELPYRGLYSGTVSAGTPVCKEENQVIQTDQTGNRVGSFRVAATEWDGRLETGQTGNQTVGYVETPEPLDAGCYVIGESKPPVGYVRSKPIAVEIYSDRVSYYLDGSPKKRVEAARYARQPKDAEERKAVEDSACIYLNNLPIRLEISKQRSQKKNEEYEVNGRLEGSISALSAQYGRENLDFAFSLSGSYLGYGWKKGFLEGLTQRQKAGEKIKLLYQNGVFTGRARLNWLEKEETSEQEDQKLSGALMTLYEAIALEPAGDREDFRYEGVNVVRDRNGNVENIYVQKGYAGRRICYVLEKKGGDLEDSEDEQNDDWSQELNDRGDGVWIGKVIERGDTDLLFYPLDGLSFKQSAQQRLEAYQDGVLCLEIECPDPLALHYSEKDKVFDQVPAGTRFYHLDAEGVRDSMVDPYTGMAYVTEEETGKCMVWPVQVSTDASGNLIAREKIKTCRPAAVLADSEEEYTVGSWNGTEWVKQINPVLDSYGRPVFYPRSPLTYQKGHPVYDRDGDYIRYRYEDRLYAFNWNAWCILEEKLLLDTGRDPQTASDHVLLFHRQGEAYLIENTWYTGEKEPNAPWRSPLTGGQTDVLKRVPAGTYILEELQAPAGYVRAMPSGLTVTETNRIQKKVVEDKPIRVIVEKTDAPEKRKIPLLDHDQLFDEPIMRIEGAGGYTYRPVEGAELVLYPANQKPLESADLTRKWLSGPSAQYMETIPKGTYILEERKAPAGFLASRKTVEIRETGELQTISLPNDHTKLEILKYVEEEGLRHPVSVRDGAELALYEAALDEGGNVKTDTEGIPLCLEKNKLDQWIATDCQEYTGAAPDKIQTSFAGRFEALYEEYGTGFAVLEWNDGEKNQQAVCVRTEETKQNEMVRQLWRTAEGKEILITVLHGLREDGTYGNSFDYQFNYRILAAQNSPFAVSYDTIYGTHRLDYLDCSEGKKYILAELQAPEGCKKVKPRVLEPEETDAVQLYGIKNEPNYLEIQKVTEEKKALVGAELALYRADADGAFQQTEEFLLERWISEEKPHRISPLAEGIYYLAELKAPSGFTWMPPKKLVVGEKTESLILVENRLKKGQLEIKKLDAEDSQKGLSGAVYELCNLDTKESWMLCTGLDGTVRSPLLETGFVKEGVWIPYRFSLQERKPPRFHALDRSFHLFQFEDTEESLLLHRETLTDLPTQIEISKTDFGAGFFLSGAKLSVYRAEEQEGSYKAVGEALEQWVSDGTVHVICKKLSAGETYLLVEEEAPAGYEVRSPQLFSVSEDGLSIIGISSEMAVLSFQMSEEFPDQLEALSIRGRQALGIRRVLKEAESGEEIEIPDGSFVVLKKEDGLKENLLYEEREETCFSDGKTELTRRRLFRMQLEAGGYTPFWRMPEKISYSIWEKNGQTEKKLVSFTTEEGEVLSTIRNPEYEDPNGISTVSRNGALGLAVLPGSVLRYEICCANAETEEKKLRISVRLDEQERWMPSVSDSCFRQNGTLLTAELSLNAGEEKRLILAAALDAEAEGKITCTVSIDGKIYEEIHPVASSGSIVLRNRVTGSGKDLVEKTFAYQVFFYTPEGEEVKGAVFCRRIRESDSTEACLNEKTGSEKTIRSGEILSVEKGEILLFSGLSWGTVCCAEEVRISRQDSELFFSALSAQKAEATAGKQPGTLRFSYEKRDGSCRALFQKGKSYVLREETQYSDGSLQQTGEQRFSLDEQGRITQLELWNQRTELLAEKLDSISKNRLSGAWLQLMLKQGTEENAAETLLEEWCSQAEQPHEITTRCFAGDRLILREKTPPEGYALAEEMEFTFSGEGGRLSLVMEDRQTQVTVRKLALDRDGMTVLGGLSGAIIRIESETGEEICRFTTGLDGIETISGLFEVGKTYLAVEEKAPFGYELSDPVCFTVLEEETEVILYDRKKERTERSEQSEKAEKTEVIEGRITVHYQELLEGFASVRLPYQRLSPLPLTGEGEPTGEKEEMKAGKMEKQKEFYALGIMLVLLLFAACWKEAEEKKTQRRGKKDQNEKTKETEKEKMQQ